MKKLLLLLLAFVTMSTYAQTANGSETQFEAVQVTNPQTVTSATGVVAIGSDGTNGKIDPVLLPLSTATINAINTSVSYINKRKLNHNFVTEHKLREHNSNYVYSGSVLTVGTGGTYSTITAAFNAASSGDILQLANGVYNIASEAGGYLLINSTTKRILIRGNSSDNSQVIIRQSSVASFCVRLRTSNEVTFQNLTIESNQATAPVTISMDTAASPVTVLFNNCVIKNTGSSAVNTISIVGNPVNNGKYEFRDCDIYQNSNATSSALAQSPVSDANSVLYYLPILITSSNVFGKIAIAGSTNINVYETNFKHSQNDIIFSIGTDTNVPTNFTSHVDVRSCFFTFTPTFTNHAVLLGRGTKDVYFVNNRVYIPSDTNPLSLGVVVKSTAANINDVLIEGNYVEAPRPLYIKGGTNTVFRNNTSYSNWGDGTDGYGFELNNPLNSDGEISSVGNIIENNNLTGNKGAIGLTYAGTTTAIDSFKLCTFKSNKYNIPTGGLYLNFPVTNWETKNLTTKQDSNSILYYY